MWTAPGVILGNELIEALNIRHTRCKQTVSIICSDLAFLPVIVATQGIRDQSSTNQMFLDI